MRKNHKGFGLTTIIIPLVVIAVFGYVGYYLVTNQTRVKINNNSTTFSFDMEVPAKNITISNSQGSIEYYQVKLSGYDSNIVATAYIPQKNIVNSDVTCLNSKFMVDILGKSHMVCNQSGKIYVTNFNYSGKWYQALVTTEDAKMEIKPETAKKFLSTIQIEQ